MLETALTKADSSVWPPLRHVGGIAAVLFAISAFGCGRPFNVKTHADLPAPDHAAKATLDGVAVEAQAITDEDLLYDTFDANLISAGVLPVRVKVTNSGGEIIDLKRARFEVQARGRRFKAVNANKAFKRLISFYGISVYAKSGYKESLDAFSAYALDVMNPLGAGESRQGLLFVLMPAEAARDTGLTLAIAKLSSKTGGASVELKLK
jgi:hypothetical protein